MVKIVVLYGAPEDQEAFEDHYVNQHAPLVAKMSGIARFEAGKVLGAADGGPPPFYRMAELWFDSAEEMQRSMESSEGQATVADIPKFATGGFTTLIAEA